MKLEIENDGDIEDDLNVASAASGSSDTEPESELEIGATAGRSAELVASSLLRIEITSQTIEPLNP